MNARARKSPSPAATTLLLTVICGFAANAFGASNTMGVCSDVAGEAKILDTPVTKLSIHMVDHFPVVGDDDVGEPIGLTDTDLPTAAPSLTLSPRVATLLDQIFATEDGGEDEVANKESVDTGATRSLVKESVAEKEVPATTLQSQMYRKDI